MAKIAQTKKILGTFSFDDSFVALSLGVLFVFVTSFLFLLVIRLQNNVISLASDYDYTASYAKPLTNVDKANTITSIQSFVTIVQQHKQIDPTVSKLPSLPH